MQCCLNRFNLTKYFTLNEFEIAYLLSLLFELLDGTFVDSTALVDQVTGGGRLTRVDVADDHDVNMDLFLRHGGCLANNGKFGYM